MSGARLLVLIGSRGTGKTTTARLLAEKLRWNWLDADTVLEQRHGRSIRQIFEEEGEAGFRDKEARIFKELCALEDHVVSTGGGVVLRPDNRELLTRVKVVWLKASPEVLWNRLQQDATTSERRPNLKQGGLVEIESVLRERSPLYEQHQHFTVDTSARSPDEVAEAIYTWFRGAVG